MQYTDSHTLLAGLIQKDASAFSFVYDQYAGALYGEILSAVIEHPVAENILTDVFLHLHRHCASIDPGKQRLFCWLLHETRRCIARHAAGDTPVKGAIVVPRPGFQIL